ncbi:MAG TPA: hypothetical protein VFR36_09615 [Sphingomicrobium sp.]|nr:hypothetical protein [Sphingomicrobium sp.]
MSDFEIMFALFSLLIGLAMAELLTGLARAWRIKRGAIDKGEAAIKVGWLVPLFGFVLLSELTRFWITAYSLREYLVFDYFHLLAMAAIIGGYFIISTFVFPDEPSKWPDFDDYFLRTNRTVVGGMIVVNLTIMLYAALLVASGAPWEETPVARSWISMVAAASYLPALAALWFARSKRTNLFVLILIVMLNLTLAIGSGQR